jgi:ATP-binding cassette subfamily B protein
LFGFAMLLLTNAATMAIPQLFRLAIDGLRAHETAENLRSIAWTMVAVALLGAIFRTLSRVHILYAARDVELGLRAQFYAHLTHLDEDFYQAYPTGDLMSRATNDLTQVRLMLGPGILNLVNTAVAYGAAIPLMAAIDLKLTCIAFVVYPPALYLMRQLGRALYRRNRQQQEALGELSNVVQENLSAATVVRAFAIEPEQIRKFAATNDNYLAANVRLAWIRSGMFRLGMSLASLGMLAVTFFGARGVLTNELTVGDIVALLEYMALLSGPTFALGWVLSMWQRGRASLARIDDVLSITPTIRSGNDSLAPGPRALEVDGLAVHYGARMALSDIHLTLPPGKTLGIVGAIGSGKSTLAQSLMRLVPLSAGRVLLDGQATDSLDLQDVRRTFAYVPQNTALLNKSLADNVAFGRPDASRQAIEKVLELASFTEDVRALPQGLDTPVGERGVTLSGGQKQRCALARALLLERPILLLDDSLSAVDTRTEQRILKALRAHQSNRSTIIIAHRTTSVEHADEIVVLDRGRVVQRGDHATLVRQGGIYADMVRRQSVEEQQEAQP